MAGERIRSHAEVLIAAAVRNTGPRGVIARGLRAAMGTLMFTNGHTMGALNLYAEQPLA